YALANVASKTLVGTLGGISILDGDRVGERYTTANSGLKHNWITAIVADDKEWLVGTYGAGVVRLTSDGQILPETAAFEVNPNAMVSSATRVYAGTLGRGLYVYDRAAKRWRSS